MADKEITLAPCPFCGSEAALKDYGVGTGGWMISCANNCGVLMTGYCKVPTTTTLEGIHAEIRTNVIAAWSHRQPDTELVEALEKICGTTCVDGYGKVIEIADKALAGHKENK